jgi:hypothetical protein
LQVFCDFHVYRSRLERDVRPSWERHDTLRRHSAAPGWQIVRRVILLDGSAREEHRIFR